jgi:Rib/alpha/Esp surface antigen-like repeat protein
MSVKIVQDDTRPPLEFNLTQDGSPVDLSGCTVKFYMKDATSGSVKISGSTCVITDATKGKCKYLWTSSDTNTAGTYVGEVEVTFPDGKIQTGYKQIGITIRADI